MLQESHLWGEPMLQAEALLPGMYDNEADVAIYRLHLKNYLTRVMFRLWSY